MKNEKKISMGIHTPRLGGGCAFEQIFLHISQHNGFLISKLRDKICYTVMPYLMPHLRHVSCHIISRAWHIMWGKLPCPICRIILLARNLLGSFVTLQFAVSFCTMRCVLHGILLVRLTTPCQIHINFPVRKSLILCELGKIILFLA